MPQNYIYQVFRSLSHLHYLNGAIAHLNCRKYNSYGSETPANEDFWWLNQNFKFLLSTITELPILTEATPRPALRCRQKVGLLFVREGVTLCSLSSTYSLRGIDRS